MILISLDFLCPALLIFTSSLCENNQKAFKIINLTTEM